MEESEHYQVILVIRPSLEISTDILQQILYIGVYCVTRLISSTHCSLLMLLLFLLLGYIMVHHHHRRYRSAYVRQDKCHGISLWECVMWKLFSCSFPNYSTA